MLTKRKRSAGASATFSADDLQIVCKLPLLTLAALLAPERTWERLALAVEWLFRPFNRGKMQRIAAGLAVSDVPLPPRGAPQRVLACQTEHNMQVLCEYVLGWRPQIELSGRENLEAARSGGRGAVLWIAHFSFNSLVSKMALADAGCRVWHVSRPEHGFTKSRFGIRFLNPIRIAGELRYLGGRIVIDRARPAAAMLEARRLLEQGEFVSITAGAWEGQLIVSAAVTKGATIEFSSGAPRLASLAGAPLLPVFVVRDEASRRFIVTVEPPVTHGPGDRDAALQHAADRFAEGHRAYLASHPLQWRDWEKLKPVQRP